MTLLRSRPFRSVSLEHGTGGAAVVVKRFHHPGMLLALFDGHRARREFAALAALARAGLPVPRPLGLVRTEAAWEVHLAAVQGAQTLGECLSASSAPPGGWEQLCARLGRLLARLEAAGWEHGDLHPGNVLVDRSGEPWLIDLQDARHVRRADPRAALAELVLCAAVARERLAPRLRLRFLLAWLAELPGELRPAVPLHELASAVEARARVRRRELVRAGLGRWLRESSRVRAAEVAGRRALVRRALDDAALAEPEGERFLVLRAGAAELRARWLGAARLHEHAVPAAAPAALLLDGRRPVTAVFERPAAGAPTRDALAALLRDRGLAPADPAPFAANPSGLYCLPPRAIRELDLRA